MYPLAPATATRTEGVPLTLPLAVLELLASARLTVLLPFTCAGITCEQACLLERQAQLVVEACDRTRQPMAHGTGLTGRAAPLDGDEDVELADGVRDRERLRDDHPERLTWEVIFEGPAIDDHAPRTRLDPHASDRRLAPSGAIEPVEHRRHLSTLRRFG